MLFFPKKIFVWKYENPNKQETMRKVFFATMHAEAKFLIFLANHCNIFPLKLFQNSLQNGMLFRHISFLF
jgi:hypothetical protein